nr:aspartate-rich protein 1-like [Macaca nemestrina]
MAESVQSHVSQLHWCSSEDNLSLVCPPPNEDDDGNHDVDDAQFSTGGCYQFDSSCCSSDDNLSLVCLPPSEVDDLDDDDDAQISPSHVQAWPEDGLFLRCSPRCKDEDDDDDDDDDDAYIKAWLKEGDLTVESLSDEEIHPGRELRARENPMGKGSQEPPGYPCCL